MMRRPVSFWVHPGGTSAAKFRQEFDALPEAEQEALRLLSARERSEALSLRILARILGGAQNGPTDNPVGTSGRMWGTQRAF